MHGVGRGRLPCIQGSPTQGRAHAVEMHPQPLGVAAMCLPDVVSKNVNSKKTWQMPITRHDSVGQWTFSIRFGLW
jgi:hypothetical protein